MRRKHFITGLGLWLLTAVALAQGFVDTPTLTPFVAPGAPPAIGPDQAAAIARARTGGRVLDVQALPAGEQAAFAVRILLDAGRVRTIVVDGQSGQIR